MVKLTPVLLVEAIEPGLKFWVDRLGFQKTVEVPDGERLGFVILVREGAEVMIQTFASAEKDVPALMKEHRKSVTFLFIEVPDVDEVAGKLQGVEVVMPMRTTFYGMKEFMVREPGGHFVCFAAKL